MINDALNWIISVFALVGLARISYQRDDGWLIYIVAQILAIWLYVRLRFWALAVTNLIFIYVCIRGYLKWQR
jgi:hypothetical protein